MKIGCFVSTNEDLLTQTLVSGLKSLGHDVVSDRGNNYTRKVDYEKEDGFDLFIEFSNACVDTMLAFNVSSAHNGQLVYVNGCDFEDEHFLEIYQDSFRYPSDYKVYFRREYRSKLANGNEYPLQFGIEDRYLKYNNKDKSIFATFPSNGEYANRLSLKSYIEENFSDVITGRIGNWVHQSPKDDRDLYYEHISKAKAIVVAHGWGEDTARFYESVATGAIVIAQRFTIDVYRPFTHGENILFWDHPSEVVKYLKEVRDGKWDHIGPACKEFALKNHTVKERAKYFFDILKKIEFYSLAESGAGAILQKS